MTWCSRAGWKGFLPVTKLRSVADHRARVLALGAPLPPESVPVTAALGRVLAGQVIAAVDLPGFDNSAMDGYAVRAVDVHGASPVAAVALPVDGDIAAGDTARHTLTPGRTLRIMTGAPMPTGADAVVPVEASDGGSEVVHVTAEPAPGAHVRRRGEDVRAGEAVLSAGTRLGPGHIGLVAASNVARVKVHRRPRVSVLSTGDELVPPGSVLAHGQIVDSNSLMLAALVEAAGAQVVGRGHLRDDKERMRATLLDIPGEPDLVLTTGGVSMGVYDTVKEVLREDGGVEFVKVAMRPGMPQGCGVVGPRRTPVVTLPGNPVSTLVSFHIFVLPLLRRLAGLDPDDDGRFTARAGAPWRTAAGKVELTRVVVRDGVVTPSGGQGSHMLGALAQAAALALVPEQQTQVEPDDVLTCLPLLGP